MENPYHEPRSEPSSLEFSDFDVNPAYVRTPQVVVSALVVGMVSYGAVLMLQIKADQLKFLWTNSLLIAIPLTVVAVVMSRLIPALVSKRLRSKVLAAKPDQAPLVIFQQYLPQLIIGAAFLESVGFLNLLLLGMTKNLCHLILAGVSVFLILAAMPTRTRIVKWWQRNAGI